MINEILNTIWKENAPDTSLDTSFVENVIKPAMVKYAQEQVENLTIPDMVDMLEDRLPTEKEIDEWFTQRSQNPPYTNIKTVKAL